MGHFVEADTGLSMGAQFNIATGSAEELNPDIVYDPFQDRFLVVWESLHCAAAFCYYEIHGVLVYGSYRDGGNLAGGEILIATDHRTDDQGHDLVTPRAAYNAEDHQFAVIYLKRKQSTWTHEAVYGQIISSHSSNPTVLTDPFAGFEIAAYSGDHEAFNPEIAWSSKGDSFLAVWERYHPTDVDSIVARHVYDTFQGTGNKQLYGNWDYTIAPVDAMSNVPSVDEYNDPSAAYDPQDDTYIVVFTHTEYSASGAETRIYAMRFSAGYIGPARIVGEPIPVETTVNANYTSHFDPHVAYSGQRGEMYVVYLTEYQEMGTFKYLLNESTVKGKIADPRLTIQTSNKDTYLSSPKVGGTGDGRGLVVWSQEYSVDPYDWDALGRRIKSYSKVYLPSVMKE
jgi:hypothetical protein